MNLTRRQLLGTRGEGTHSNRDIPWQHAGTVQRTHPRGFEGSGGDERLIVVLGTLGTARLQLRLDINFGDPTSTQKIEYPTLLSDELIDLLGYSVETVIAEKVETMISGATPTPANATTPTTSWRSPGSTPLEARRLRHTLEQTAAHRGTELMPLAQVLDTLPTARRQDWRAFLDRSRLATMPERFEETVSEVTNIVDPVLRKCQDLVRWDPSAREWERRE